MNNTGVGSDYRESECGRVDCLSLGLQNFL